MQKYKLKARFDPCVVLKSSPMIVVSNNPVGSMQYLTDELAEQMLLNGHRPDIFEVTPDKYLPKKPTFREMVEDLEKSKSKILLYQIYYNDQTKQDVNPAAIGYDNSGKETVFFENTAIIDIINNLPECKYVGILSHKFFKKMPHFITYEAIEAEINKTKHDVYGFNPQHKKDISIIKKSQNYHENFTELFKLICEQIGLKYHEKGNRAHIYGNHFICKSHVYKEYVRNVLAPAVKVMQDTRNTKIWEMVWADSRYNRHDRKALKNMQDKFGINYYPMHTFICERLFTIWLDTNNYSFKTLWR